MIRTTTLVVDGITHNKLKKHLFMDTNEAVLILLCSRAEINGALKLLTEKVIFIPHDECSRANDRICWPGKYLDDAVDVAESDDRTIVIMHSHPGGYFDFSEVDNQSDREVIPSIFADLPSERLANELHGTALMTPDGAIKARLYDHKHSLTEIDLTAIYGDNVSFFWNNLKTHNRPMAFTDGMKAELSKLSVSVVGVSGTGSIVAEQLARIGFGHINVVDFDRVELKNLNRILNSTAKDSSDNSLKVDVFKKAVEKFSPSTNVFTTPLSINNRRAITSVAETDILFCCVDSQMGRNICDLISSAFLIPLFDVGVVIPIRKQPNGNESILDINVRLDYVQPRGSSLLDRGVYSPEGVAAEDLAQIDPALYDERVREGYMPGSLEEAPAVITSNMYAASLCVQEFIARAYPYRLNNNRDYARTLISLGENEMEFLSEDDFNVSDLSFIAKAFGKPLLGIPSLED